MHDDEQRADYQRMKGIIEPELQRIADLIYLWGPLDDDQEFTDLVNKARYYRDILQKINIELNKSQQP